MKKPTAVGLGEVLWDMFPEGAMFGGAPANSAAHCAALGADGYMVSSVGKDVLGDSAIEELEGRGLNIDFVARSDYPTGAVEVQVDDEGKASYEFLANVAWDHLAWTPQVEELASNTSAAQ